jgi:hypothetical protein
MTDRELLTELQYALIEPPDGGDTWPSLIWTRAEVLDAVNGALRALARDCHLLVARTEIPVAASAAVIALPGDWLATAHLVWRAVDGTRTPLGPVDSFEGDLAMPGWETIPALPLGYADLDGPTLTLRLVPTPAAAGTLELLYLQAPPAVDGTNLPLAVVEECSAGVKYQALGWLLRKVGRLIDPERAQYCERRYELTRTVTAIILEGWS